MPIVLKKSASQLVADAMAQVRTLSLDEARALHASAGALFVDLRDVRELERDGVIPGAFHAPRGMLEFWACADSPYHKPVFSSGKKLVLFCAAGWRSALATKTLQDMGFDDVGHIDGGFDAWKQAGAPVAAKPPRAAKPR